MKSLWKYLWRGDANGNYLICFALSLSIYKHTGTPPNKCRLNSALKRNRATVRLDIGQRGSLCPPFSMSAVRPPVFIGLLLLILTTGYCKPRDRDETSLLELLMDRVRQTQEHHSEGNTQHPPQIIEHSLETKDVNKVTKSYQHERILEVFPRDLRQKDKFLKHLTGPLYFSPKCSKLFYKLYNNTRDCTIPAYYKRCARLLTRLAGSQRCTEG